MRRIWMSVLIVVASVSGAAVAADVLVTSEREQLDEFVDAATEAKLERRLDGTLAFIDPNLVPFRLMQSGDAHEYREGERGALAEAMRTTLGVFDSSEQELLQHAVKVDGERATVTTRMGDSAYEQTVIYDLVREGDRWLLRRARAL